MFFFLRPPKSATNIHLLNFEHASYTHRARFILVPGPRHHSVLKCEPNEFVTSTALVDLTTHERFPVIRNSTSHDVADHIVIKTYDEQQCRILVRGRREVVKLDTR